MKLLIDDTTARTHNLNANEACVYAAILKCTKAGRGWFANYRDLANALPFVISHETVRRAVDKLLNLGLIERRDKALFALTQNVTDLTQNVTNSVPPITPLYNNDIMNEKEHATCAHACDTRETPTPSFNDLTTAFGLKGGNMTSTQFEAAKELWKNCTPAKKIKLLEAVKSGAHFKQRLDWLISDFPEPEPEFLRGDEDGRIVQVRYNGLYKLCTPETMKLFGLEYVRIWK